MKSFGVIIFLGCAVYLEALKFDNTKSDILPTKEECGLQSGTEFPWVVYVPLETRTYNPDAKVRCAGVIINKRYVAIAKSCLQFVLTKVVVGQHDTSKTETCDGSDCSPVQEITVEERIVHDDWDVVLLRLTKNIEFTKKVRPICLPFEELKRAEVGETVYSSGWGLKSVAEGNSLTKKSVKETLLKIEDCQDNQFIKHAKGLRKFLCVKVQDDSTHKPCSGDEGSPIMHLSNDQWVLEGVMTYLFDATDKPCAITSPAAGIKVNEEILEWIVDKIHA